MNEGEIKRIYNRQSSTYDYLIWPFNTFLLDRIRKKIISGLSGNILEVGIGTGGNLPYYDKRTHIVGIDLSPDMLEKATDKAQTLGLDFEAKEMSAEQLQFSDGTFDAVVSTLTLCTFINPTKALQEMHRVTKKGGAMYFLEHGKSNVGFVERLQKMREKTQLKAHACHLMREPADLVTSAGFEPKNLKRSFFGVFSVMRVDV